MFIFCIWNQWKSANVIYCSSQVILTNTRVHDQACRLARLKTGLLVSDLISATGRADYATFAIYRTCRIKLWLVHVCCALYIEQHSETVTTHVTHFCKTISPVTSGEIFLFSNTVREPVNKKRH